MAVSVPLQMTSNTAAAGGVFLTTSTPDGNPVDAGSILSSGLLERNADGIVLSKFLSNLIFLSGTTLTLSSVHLGSIIVCTSSSAVTITLPRTLPANYSAGILQFGTGQVTAVAGSGAALNNFVGQFATAARYAMVCALVVTNTDGNTASAVLTGATA
jgi:hypothetical protein